MIFNTYLCEVFNGKHCEQLKIVVPSFEERNDSTALERIMRVYKYVSCTMKECDGVKLTRDNWKGYYPNCN